MKIGSLLDNKSCKKITYSYYQRGTLLPYLPDHIKEEETLDCYTNENGNLFFERAVAWYNSNILLGGIDLTFNIGERTFIDNIDICQGEGSAIKSVEVFARENDRLKKIGSYVPETNDNISTSQFTISVGYYCDNVILRINGDCMPVVIEKLDIWAAWELEDSVYPTPANIEFKNDKTSLETFKTVKAVNDDEKSAASYLCEKVERLTGHKIDIVEANGDIEIKLGDVAEKDSYILDVENGKCSIVAPNRISLHYAADAFTQLIDGDMVKCCHIEDEAFMEFRGFHIGMPSKDQVPFVKNIIKNLLVPMRYNSIIVEVASTMRYDNFPEINEAWLHCIEMYEKGEWPCPAHYGMLSKDIWEKDELRELLDYFESFGFDVIPEVQSYSHSQYITTAYPEIAEKIDVKPKGGMINHNKEDVMPDFFYPPTLCPSYEKYYDIVLGIADEVIDVFKPKKYVHMGHDEILHVGCCEKCSKIPRGDLLAKELTTLNDHIKSKGLKMIIWSDSLQDMPYGVPTAINKVPKDIIMMDFVWYFHLDKDIEVRLLDHGFDVVMGNMYSSHYPRFESRAHRKGMLGAQISMWAANVEKGWGFKGKIYDTAFSAEGMWNTDYNSKFRLTYNELIKPFMKETRMTIGNLKCDGIEKSIDIGGCVENVPYDIRGIVPYKSAVSVNPYKLSQEIKVDDYAKIISVVHATDKEGPRRFFHGAIKCCEYVFTYEDDTEYTEKISYGGEIYKYLSTYGSRLEAPMFRHEGYIGAYLTIPECGKTYDGKDYTLGKYSIRNPYPEKKIKSIKLNHTGDNGVDILLFDLSVKN